MGAPKVIVEHKAHVDFADGTHNEAIWTETVPMSAPPPSAVAIWRSLVNYAFRFETARDRARAKTETKS